MLASVASKMYRVVVVLVVVVAGGLLWEVGRVVGCEARALVWS